MSVLRTVNIHKKFKTRLRNLPRSAVDAFGNQVPLIPNISIFMAFELIIGKKVGSNHYLSTETYQYESFLGNRVGSDKFFLFASLF